MFQVFLNVFIPVICGSKEIESLTMHFSPEIGMHVEIRDPDDKIILSKVHIWPHISCNGVVVQNSKSNSCPGLQQ